MASCDSSQQVSHDLSRIGEKEMAKKLLKWAAEGLIPLKPTWNKQNAHADPIQCGKYRPDYVFEQETGVVIEEYDENGHANYNIRCELVRQGNVSLGYGGRPCHWIRYNPDHFSIDGQTVPDDQTRDAIHLKHLQSAIQNPDYENPIKVDYLFYKPLFGGEGGIVQSFKFSTIEEYCMWVERVSDDDSAESMASTSTKRIWLITYDTKCPNITHTICSDCGIAVDECYTTTQDEFKYTLLHLKKRKGISAIQKMMHAAKDLFGITPRNIFGHESFACYNSKLKEHPGFITLIDHMNRKDSNFEHWLSEGDLYSKARGVMHRFLIRTDVSSPKLTRTQLEFLLEKKCKEFDEEREELRARLIECEQLDEEREELRARLIECEQLNEALGEQNDELRAKYKRARTEISKLKATLSIYEDDSE